VLKNLNGVGSLFGRKKLMITRVLIIFALLVIAVAAIMAVAFLFILAVNPCQLQGSVSV